MSKRFRIEGATGLGLLSAGEQFAKRVVFLAWQGFGSPFRLGLLQDRGPDVQEEKVWEQAYYQLDYADDQEQGMRYRARSGLTENEIYRDYVMGCRMKFGFQWGNQPYAWVEAQWPKYNRKKNDHCEMYPDFGSLVRAAAFSLKVEVIEEKGKRRRK